jgi:HEPN domain-containing protein
MPDKKESLYPQDWIEKAEKDLRRVRVLLADDDTEGAGFHLQQAIEKYLKGYLLSKGWKLEYVHSLVKLLNYAKDYDSSFEEFRALCEQAIGYYIVDRYPFPVYASPTREEIEQALRKTEGLVKKIDAEVK